MKTMFRGGMRTTFGKRRTRREPCGLNVSKETFDRQRRAHVLDVVLRPPRFA